MAELLGTVVGVVSLGLQVASGINTYVGGIQGHKEDIEFTTRRSKSMETLLNQISSLRDRLPTSASTHGAALEQAMTQAKSELARLQDYVSRISAESGSPTNSALAKMKAQTKKVLYPFRRDHVDRLNSQLEAANKTLSTGCQLAELEVSISNDGTLRKLNTCLTDSHTTMVDIERQVRNNMSMMITTQHDTVMIKNNLSEVKAMIMALMPVDASTNGQALFRGLMSKPDALRVACDNTGLEQPQRHQSKPSLGSASSNQANISSGFECHCNFKSRRIIQRQKRHYGPAFLCHQIVTQNAHQVGCPYANWTVHADYSWSAGISVKAFQGLLSAAVTVTMSSAFGAGGFGLSPFVTYYPLRDTSPAFRVMQQLDLAFLFDEWTDEESRYLIERGIQSLKTVFSAKTSSPLDLFTDGSTLLELAVSTGWHGWSEPLNALLKFLVGVGAPKDRPGADDRLPFQDVIPTCLHRDKESPLMGEALDILYPDEPIFSFEGKNMTEALRIYETRRVPSSRMTELYEGHPLGAIFLRNRKSLAQILDKSPSVLDLSALDQFGYTALHDLISWNEGLESVLKRLGKEILRIHDRHRISALECAFTWSDFICTNETFTTCPESCSCGTSVKLLLETDDECLIRAVARPCLFDSLSYASHRAKELVVDDLKHRRDELKELARAHLKPADIDRLALGSPETLDEHMGEVLRILNKQSVTVPTRLLTETRNWQYKVFPSVYHSLCHSNSVSLLNLFYSKGFHAIDIFDEDGYTPLAKALGNTAINWLIQHGASLKAQIPKRPFGYTTAHYFFSRIWTYTLEDYDETLAVLESIENFEFDTQDTDTCRCACSSNGCHPCTAMVREIFQAWGPSDLTYYVRRISRQFSAIENVLDIPRDTKSLCVRACTFAALELHHTCCAWRGSRLYEDKEFEEIWGEDSTDLELLETLLVEFEDSLDRMGGSLTNFFIGVWSERMKEVRIERESQNLTEDEIQGARSLGVWLRVSKETGKGSSQETHDLAYWARQLDAAIE